MSAVPEDLADLIRPQNFGKILGQDHLVGKEGVLTQHILEGRAHSILLIGPPGSGKTTIGNIYANFFKIRFLKCHLDSIHWVKLLLLDLEKYPCTLLFFDDFSPDKLELAKHFEPYIQSGKVVLIGASIEPMPGSIEPFKESYNLNELNISAMQAMLERVDNVVDIPPTLDRQNLINLSQFNGNILVNLLREYPLKNPPPSTLKDLIRPKAFDEVIGQEHLVGDEGALRKYVAEGIPRSILLMGAIGVGSTAIARIYGKSFGLKFLEANPNIHDIVESIVIQLKAYPEKIVLLLEEFHYFTSAQQQMLLPFVQQGKLIIIGTTPKTLNTPLTPFLEVFELKDLTDGELREVLKRIGKYVGLSPDFIENYQFKQNQNNAQYLTTKFNSMKRKFDE